MIDSESLDRYIQVVNKLSDKGQYSWWKNLENLLIELKELRKKNETIL